MSGSGDLLHVVSNDNISDSRKTLGRGIIWGAGLLMALVALAQLLQVQGLHDFGLTSWRPTLYAYILWAICLS